MLLLCFNITWFILGTYGILEKKYTLPILCYCAGIGERAHNLGGREAYVQLPALSKVVLFEACQLLLGTGARIKLNNAHFKIHGMGLNE